MLDSDSVRKIGFTGSTAVGKHLMAGAAATVKRVSLELVRLGWTCQHFARAGEPAGDERGQYGCIIISCSKGE